MHKLTIKNGQIYLDEFPLQDVVEYELKHSAANIGSAELNLKLCVKGLDVSFNDFGEDVGKAAINFMAQEARRGRQPLQSP